MKISATVAHELAMKLANEDRDEDRDGVSAVLTKGQVSKADTTLKRAAAQNSQW